MTVHRLQYITSPGQAPTRYIARKYAYTPSNSASKRAFNLKVDFAIVCDGEGDIILVGIMHPAQRYKSAGS